MKKRLVLPFATLFLVGCGGGSTSNGDTGSSAKDVNMNQGQPYTVYSGNKIIKYANPTVVKISHTDGQSTSTVMLLEGNATIIRKP